MESPVDQIRIIILIFLMLTIHQLIYSQTTLPQLATSLAPSDSYTYADKLEDLINGEKWGWHSDSLGFQKASSVLEGVEGIDYGIENIKDFDLKTAWVPKSYHGEFLSFQVDASRFKGNLEFFNGYCKSEAIWEANSRIKLLRLFVNGQPIALINLADTWQYQSLAIASIPYDFTQITEKLVLKFEILEVYPGSRYRDVALSELTIDRGPR